MLENKIKTEAEAYEIKTSSATILNKYHNKNHNSKAKPFRFIYLVPMLAACIVAIIAIFYPTNSTIIVDNKEANTISLEMSSSLGLLKSQITNDISYLKRSNDNISKDEFENICDNFIDNYTVLNESILYKNNQKHQVTFGNYTVNDNTYSFRIDFDDETCFYYQILKDKDENQINESYDGILLLQDNYYQVFGKKEININNDEDEINLTIKIDSNTYIYIEQESERSEYSYSYEIIKNENTIYELEIDFENDEIEMECTDNEKEYEYNITINNYIYEVEYEYADFEGIFTMKIDENENSYIFEEKNNSYFYKIYQ